MHVHFRETATCDHCWMQAAWLLQFIRTAQHAYLNRCCLRFAAKAPPLPPPSEVPTVALLECRCFKTPIQWA